jgi:peptide/nickel transport system permease protein
MGSLRQYIIKRLLLVIPTFFGVSILAFMIQHFSPGDPVALLLNQQVSLNPAQMEALRHQLGLDLPWYEQYWKFLTGMLQGNLGLDLRTYLPVSTLVMSRFPYTLELALAALCISIGVGVPVGIIAAMRQNSALDNTLRVSTIAVASLPNFWFGLILIIVFAVDFKFFPISGAASPTSVVLPAVTLGAIQAAVVARITRTNMLDVIRQDYIRTARAKGLPQRVIVFKHALRNALLPTVTILGIQFGFLLGGSFIVETVFAWPGVGQLAVDAIIHKDFNVVQGVIVVTSLSFILVNVFVDILYAYLDPRIRFEETKVTT